MAVIGLSTQMTITCQEEEGEGGSERLCERDGYRREGGRGGVEGQREKVCVCVREKVR